MKDGSGKGRRKEETNYFRLWNENPMGTSEMAAGAGVAAIKWIGKGEEEETEGEGEADCKRLSFGSRHLECESRYSVQWRAKFLLF